MRTLRALPAIFRISLAAAVAYRAETFVWVLTSSMPLIMLPLWHAVAEEAPVEGFDRGGFTAYFFGAFVVRQVVGAWAAWTINYEVRTGALNQRLLRPAHPLFFYAGENIASIPIRATIAFPVGMAALIATGGSHLPHGWAQWAMVPLSFAGAWGIAFFAQVFMGSLSLWMHQSIKLLDLWMAGFFVLSGYLVPIALFPESVRDIPHWLPFEYQLGFPVSLLTGKLSTDDALAALAAQWTWVAILGGAAIATWNRGIARYGAFGG